MVKLLPLYGNTLVVAQLVCYQAMVTHQLGNNWKLTKPW